MKYNTIIIGAGPGGLFAGYKLVGKKVAIFEMGKSIEKRICPSDLNGVYCTECSPCHIRAGIGGAGGLSDGKLNFVNPDYSSSYTVGGEFGFLDRNYLGEKMKEVDEIFTKHGGTGELYGEDKEKIDELVKKSNKVGIEFVPLNTTPIFIEEPICDTLYEEDIDCNGCVDQIEITSYGNRWLTGDPEVSAVEATTAAYNWKEGISSCE